MGSQKKKPKRNTLLPINEFFGGYLNVFTGDFYRLVTDILSKRSSLEYMCTSGKVLLPCRSEKCTLFAQHIVAKLLKK